MLIRITKNTLTFALSGGKELTLPVSEIEDIIAVSARKPEGGYRDVYLGIALKEGQIYKIEDIKFEILSIVCDLIKATLKETGKR